MKGRGKKEHQPCSAFERCGYLAPVVLGADAQLGEKGARSLQVDLGDVCKAAEHAVHGGLQAFPVLPPVLSADAPVRSRPAAGVRHRYGDTGREAPCEGLLFALDAAGYFLEMSHAELGRDWWLY